MTAETYVTDAATRHAVFVERFAGGEANKAKDHLERIRLGVIERLSRDPTDFRADRLGRVLNDIDTLISLVMQEMSEEINETVRDFASNEASFAGELIQSTSRTEVALPSDALLIAVINREGMSAPLGPEAITIQEALDQFAGKKSQEVLQTIKDAMVAGDTLSETTDRVSDLVNGRQKTQVEALTRTIMNHTSNHATKAVMQENQAILQGEKWVATLDSRTTLVCFDGSVPVVPLGSLEAIFRRKYRGEMVTITTASGNKIKGTPNHPVLTDRGWLPLNEIKPNEHIVYSALGDVVGVESDQDINMPTKISELFDAACELSSLDVERVSPSADDFHGDGQIDQGEVSVVAIDSLLRRRLVSLFCKEVENDLLGSVELSAGLNRDSLGDLLGVGRLPVSKPPQFSISSVEGGINKGLGSSELPGNVAGSISRPEQPDSLGTIFDDSIISNPSRSVWHDTNILKSVGHCGSGDTVSPSDACGGFSGTVTGDKVVDVSVEFSACHVYNLQTSLNLYNAGGIIVHNCAGRDGRIYPVGQGPYPPSHWQCRSRRVPVVAEDFAVEGVTGKRGAVGGKMVGGELVETRGQVRGDTTYGGWLKRQPVAFQEEVLGPKRAELFRQGKIPLDRFRDETGRVYTLEQLKALNPLAFDRADVEV